MLTAGTGLGSYEVIELLGQSEGSAGCSGQSGQIRAERSRQPPLVVVAEEAWQLAFGLQRKPICVDTISISPINDAYSQLGEWTRNRLIGSWAGAIALQQSEWRRPALALPKRQFRAAFKPGEAPP
jgi:hypothetical protein